MNKKSLKLSYEIGEVYEFDYESSSTREDKREKTLVVMPASMKDSLCEYLKEHAKEIKARANEQYARAKEIQSTKDKELQATLKAEYNEEFRSSSDEKPAIIKAQNLFFRNYKEENMREGKSIQAIYAGKQVTINGLTTDKWYCITPVNVVKDYLTEDVSEFLHD